MASGLDTLTSNILPGESGGLPTDELSTESTPSDGGLTSVKAPSVKGGFGFGSPVLDATNSAEVLKNMQKFIDERSSPYHKFISNLDDARAAAVANVHGEGTNAVNAREKQKEEEAKTIFDMQNQMAALKAAQATQARQREQLLSAYATAHPQAGSNVVIPGSSSSPNGMPESMWEDYKQALNNNDLAGAAKIKSDWNKYTAQEGYKARTNFENSGPGNTQAQYTVKTAEGVRQVDLTPLEWTNAQRTGKLPDGTPLLTVGPSDSVTTVTPPPVGPQGTGLSLSDIRKVESGNKPFAVGPNVPGQGSAKSSMQVMDATSTNPGFGVKPAQLTGDKVHDEAELTRVGTDYFNALKTKYGNDTLAAAAYNMGPGATDAWIAAGADYKKLPQETKDYIAKVHLANATSGLAKPATAAPATAAPATAAPATAAPATTTAGDNEKRAQAYWDTHPPQNKAQFDKQKSDIEEARKADVALASEKEKERTKAKLQGTITENQASGKAAAKMQDLAAHADDVIGAASQVAEHAKVHPEEFAWTQQPGLKGAGLSMIGAISPTVELGVENVLQTVNPNKDEQGLTKADRRNQTNTDAGKLGFAAASELFAGSGARLGVGLEQMVAKSKGVGTEHSASTNVMNASLIKMAAQKAKDLAPAWTEYKNSKPAGEADYYTFLQTDPKAKFIETKWDPAFKQWVDTAKKEAPDYYKQLVSGSSKPDIKSFYKKK